VTKLIYKFLKGFDVCIVYSYT